LEFPSFAQTNGPNAVPTNRTTAVLLLNFCRIALLAAAMAFPNPLPAQYPDVHLEPFHRPILERGPFRYLDVNAATGDTTAMHTHRLPILYLCVSGSEVWLDEEGDNRRRVTLPKGWVGSDLYSDSAIFNHRFAVIGSSDLHIIAVERMGVTEGFSDIRPTSAKPVYHKNGFAVYTFSGKDLNASGEKLHSSGQHMEWPMVLAAGEAVPSFPAGGDEAGKKSGPGDVLIPEAGPWKFSKDAELWMVVPSPSGVALPDEN